MACWRSGNTCADITTVMGLGALNLHLHHALICISKGCSLVLWCFWMHERGEFDEKVLGFCIRLGGAAVGKKGSYMFVQVAGPALSIMSLLIGGVENLLLVRRVSRSHRGQMSWKMWKTRAASIAVFAIVNRSCIRSVTCISPPHIVRAFDHLPPDKALSFVF